jgi:toxin ParE1/3/4
MAFKVIIKPVVWLDVDEAIEWYEKESPGLGLRFIKSFEEAKEKLIKQPGAYKNITPLVKRILLKNFPYKVFYNLSGDTIFIIGVAHAGRSNAFIKRKLKDFKS